MELNEILEKRLQGIVFTVESITKKIVKKEIKKFKRDIIKQLSRGVNEK